ncbi:ATP-dependent endonuclease [Pedobacter sp. WC2423]|uniref:ATP-dependent endonuclease n=1 Tax=Pedobacter sp. WC2423 TaxID=3234142 RepID=UPI003466FA71
MVRNIDFVPNNVFLADYLENEIPIKSLESVSRINFFVGANNSGKSRFLRNMAIAFKKYQSPDFSNPGVTFPGEKVPTQITLLRLNSDDLLKDIEALLARTRTVSKSLYEVFIQKIVPGKMLTEFDLMNVLDQFVAFSHPNSKHLSGFNATEMAELADIQKEFKTYVEDKLPLPAGQGSRVTYIPAYRSLRRFKEYPKKNDNPYRGFPSQPELFEKIDDPIIAIRTALDYFFEKDKPASKYESSRGYELKLPVDCIFSGETLYEKIAELRNGNEDKRAILTGFESFLSKKFFNGKRLELNAITHDDIQDLFVKIGEEKEFPIFHLGDGIQAVILLTFPLFYYRGYHHVLLCEEPELYLHPGMQRIFVDALRAFPYTKSFVVTHSNHILDTSLDYKADISIFSFEKMLKKNKPVFKIQTLSSPGLSILNMLGVRNSSIFLSNCCIWVEGISDRVYLKKYLELLMAFKNNDNQGRIFSEDLHYSFLEFGGNQVVHYDFAEEGTEHNDNKIKAIKVTNRLLLIHDLDEGKQERHKLLATELGEQYIALPVREIENLLTPSVLRKTLQAYQKDEEGEPLIFNDFSQEDYVMTPIAKLIKQVLVSGALKKICSEPSKSQTPKLINKADFALTATGAMKTWDDVSEDGKKLTIQVYEFINRHNIL